ncbi:unnamed protein product, partial [Musa textilis]
ERERERERGLWTRVWIPFLPTKQHSNLCCALMAALGCAHDNESPFRPTSDNCIGHVCIHPVYSTTRKPFPHHMLQYSLQHLPRRQPNTKPCMLGAAAAVHSSYTACFGSTLQVRPTSISWHR